jgi:hypothetical protein
MRISLGFSSHELGGVRLSSRYAEICWTDPRPYQRSSKPYNAFTVNFLWDLSLLSYVTTEQAGVFYGASLNTIRRHLTFWHNKGLIQGAWVPYRHQRTRIWTLAPGGVELLQEEDDTAWDLLHPRWVSSPDQHRTLHTQHRCRLYKNDPADDTLSLDKGGGRIL